MSDNQYNHQIDDYLANRLTDGDIELFEAQLMDDTDLQKAVLVQRALKRGLIENKQALLAPAESNFLDRLQTLITTPFWSYAATVSLLVILGVMFNEEEPSQFGIIEGTSTDNRLTRGVDASDTTIKIDRSITNLAKISTEDKFVDLRITSNGNLVFEKNNISPDGFGNLLLVIPPLSAGSYQVEITSASGETIIYPIFDQQ